MVTMSALLLHKPCFLAVLSQLKLVTPSGSICNCPLCGLLVHAVVMAWAFWVYRKLKQSCLMNCVVTASQNMYNKAWVGDDFVLDYR